MSIHIDSCAELDAIRVDTRSSVYELVVLRGDFGDVLLRGGRRFKEFQRVLFIGSIADGGAFEPRTIAVGLRMRFVVADRVFMTSAVESFSHAPPVPPRLECAQRTGGVHA